MLPLLTLFILVRILEATGHLPQLAASYADDLLCLPLVLGGVLFCHRRWGMNGPGYTLPHSHGLMTLALFAVYFEGVLPGMKATAVADPYDILMYLIGYLVFEILINKPNGKLRRDSGQEFA